MQYNRVGRCFGLMSNHNPGNEGAAHPRVNHADRPYWKRAHHDWRFWIAMFLMLLAIAIYVLSDDLAFLPHGPQRRQPQPAVGR